MKPLFSTLLLLSLCVCPLQSQPPAAPEPPSAKAAADTSPDPRIRGAHVFADAGCPQCHTMHHQGGTKGPDLSTVGRRLNATRIRAQIQDGGKQMPPFGDVLATSETDDLVAYLLSCRDKRAK